MTTRTQVLIVDDDEEYLRSLSASLSADFEPLTAATLDDARAAMSEDVAMCLVDVRLSETDPGDRAGLEFLEWIRMNHPDTPVIMMSRYRDFDMAVDSLNLGASFFLRKPITMLELKALLRLFAEKQRAEKELARLKARVEELEAGRER